MTAPNLPEPTTKSAARALMVMMAHLVDLTTATERLRAQIAALAERRGVPTPAAD